MPSIDRCAKCSYEYVDMQAQPCKQCLDDVQRGRGYTKFADTAYYEREAKELREHTAKCRSCVAEVKC